MYSEKVLIKTVVITPNQMHNNIIKNILKNLMEDVDGKCYGANGVVTKVHGIKRLFGGGIPAEDIRAAAYYNVHFMCTLCKPEEGAIVEGKVIWVGNNVIVMRNGPVNILATNKRCAVVGENCKVKVLSVTMMDGDTEITATGKIIN
jgi:DNA-directed RNA polymerase subunit E'/Rpb7